MPRIFDNIDLQLLPALCQTLQVADPNKIAAQNAYRDVERGLIR
jgi:hypothetical protein